MKIPVPVIALVVLFAAVFASFTTTPSVPPTSWITKQTWMIRTKIGTKTYGYGVIRCVPLPAVQARFSSPEQVGLRRTLYISLGRWGFYVQPRPWAALAGISAAGLLVIAGSASVLHRSASATFRDALLPAPGKA